MATITGRVGAVADVQRGMFMVREVVVEADGKAHTVRLGPTRFLEQASWTLTSGETVEVHGSLVKEGGQDLMLVARIKTANGDTHVLRDEAGRMNMKVEKGRGRATAPTRTSPSPNALPSPVPERGEQGASR